MKLDKMNRRSTMRRPLPEDIPELRDMIECQHMSMTDCAKHYGCSVPTISKRCVEYGITISRARNARLTLEDEALIVILVKEGLSVADVADKFEETQKFIRAVLWKYKIKLRKEREMGHKNVVAKNQLGMLVTEGVNDPHIVTSNGRPVAVIVPYDEESKGWVK